LLAPGPTPKLEEQSLSAIRHCLFNTFAATCHIWCRSSNRSLRTRHVVETRTHLSRSNCNKFEIYKLYGLNVGWTRRISAGKWGNDCSQLLWGSFAQSRLLQKWPTWMLLC